MTDFKPDFVPVASEFARAGLRSGPEISKRVLSDKTHPGVLRPLRDRAGASSLATRSVQSADA